MGEWLTDALDAAEDYSEGMRAHPVTTEGDESEGDR